MCTERGDPSYQACVQRTMDSSQHGVVSPQEQIEDAIRLALDRRDLRQAAALIVRDYGEQVLRFLHVRLRSRSIADEAFSMVCEDLWVGLPGFRGAASVRTWLFVLARHAATQAQKMASDLEKRQATIDDERAEVREHVRTTTAIFRRTEIKDKVRGLRERLDDDQQTLLVLRLERGLAWKELAVVMDEALPDATEAELSRASARVRTRFQAAKRRLRELAQEAGLFPVQTNDA